ncbi:hypothetical protein [Natranaeroarchaeum sulfidigenes]|uniref:Uncharacterized protein n=1 Tax=Natranaeroarchaeum sulfidigenes TaxID=2784880 RepID=A0A897MLC5_9EURY|nr:hypothetical protein [Natranaeroarchaeum sulfidigenes]QSG02980.1 Uncharacterized protein AArcS_1770 [Natranaeroarchaeum sulfidigenes]
MELTPALVERLAAEYEREAPFHTVEQESIETLPAAFESGEFGRRDASWVVEWYYRREMGALSNRERREREDAFEGNDRREIKRAIVDAATADSLDDALDRLTQLDGIDVPVASAFLFFIDPERYLVVGEREWNALSDAGELHDPYPNPPTRAEYERYLNTCRSIAERLDCDLPTLYRALRQLSQE